MNMKNRKPYNSQNNISNLSNSKSHLQNKKKVPLKDVKESNLPDRKDENKNSNIIVNQSQGKNNNNPNNKGPNCFDSIANFVKMVWGDKLKRYIALGIIGGILLIVIIIIIVVCVTKSSNSDNDNIINENEIIIFPSQPYSGLSTYTDDILKTELINDCNLEDNSDKFKFALEAIKRHNTLRSYHNAEPLKFNKDLMQKAQDYADQIPFEHSDDYNTLGENLYWYGNIKIDGKEPVDEWYKEFSKYNFHTSKSKGGVISHFTQVVWKETTDFGIAYSCKETNCVVVAYYSPKGNIEGKYQDNIQDYIK